MKSWKLQNRKHGICAHLYADNKQLCLTFSLNDYTAEEAVHIMEECISEVKKWMSQNKLKLNDDRTELLIIVPSQQTHKCNIVSITIGDCDVAKSDCEGNLGILFDSTMQMKQRIAAVVNSCNI